jgi:AMMECR1 domain-containing protein
MHTCLKAGLSRQAWKRDALIYAFEAEVFGEYDAR